MVAPARPPPWRLFLDRLLGHRRDEALALIADVAGDVGAAGAIVEVLAPGQTELGALWERCDITIDQEQLATATVDAALARLASPRPGPEQGTIVSACVPGEWHVLPARMANAVLELAGWQVRFTGANTLPDHLRRQVTTHRPTAVAISCAMPSRLPAAQDLITVAHDEGVPVVVGGRAFNEARARRLGADAWIADPRDAVDVLAGWAGQPPALARPHPPGEEFATLVIDGDVLASRVIDRLGHALGGIGGTLARQLEVGVRLLQEHLTAAVYLEDGTIFLDAVQWSAGVGERRGFPSWTAVTGLGALEAELATDMGCTRDLVEAAVASLEP